VSDSLRKRILTAAVLVVGLLVILLWLPPAATLVVVTVLVLAGAWEWSAFLRLAHHGARIIYTLSVAALMWAAWALAAQQGGMNLLLAAAIVWWLAALLWILFAPRSVASWSAAAAGALALVPSWLALLKLRLVSPNGAQWVLFALVLVWIADIGAYFCGRLFGRVRLAPAVSPGKTWEGVFGAIAVSVLVAIAGSAWFHVTLVAFLPLCLATVGFSIVGDLTESLLKRFAGIKDSGTLFPGHGGVMDRIDSLTGAAPVWVLGLKLLGVVAA
jgi:phosphatidate cytidylyltransferase